MNGIEWVKVKDLRLPPTRLEVDSFKFHRQVAQFRDRFDGMPPLEVTRCAGGEMYINSGVTRATRAYRYGGPEMRIPIIIIEERPAYDATHLPKVS